MKALQRILATLIMFGLYNIIYYLIGFEQTVLLMLCTIYVFMPLSKDKMF